MQLIWNNKQTNHCENPQVNAILEHVHGVLGNVMRTSGLDMSPTITDSMITDFIVDAAWAICSTYHNVLKSTPGAAIFGRDILFDIPYIADWNGIGCHRQEQVNNDNTRINLTRLPFDDVVG